MNPQSMFLSKNKPSEKVYNRIFNFNNLYITWACFRNVVSLTFNFSHICISGYEEVRVP